MSPPLLQSVTVIALLIGYPAMSAVASQADTPSSTSGATLGDFGIDTALMDRTVVPGEDFYKYVNGKWLATTKIPADRSRYGSFIVLRDQSEVDQRVLLEDLTHSNPTEPTLRKITDLYAAWMDEAGIEKRGLTPLQSDLNRIAAATEKSDLMKLVGDINMSSPIGLGIMPDPADTTRYAVFIGQAGLGMGRDYYINEGPEYDAYREAYQDYIRTVLELTGDKNAKKNAESVFELEMNLAQVHWSPAQTRDVQATYNPMDRKALQELTPTINWPIVLEATGLGDVQNFIVAEKSAIVEGAALLESFPLDTWKKYFVFHRTSDSANLLPKTFDDAHFEFYGKTMRGTEQQRDRWKRGVALVDRNIGEGLGKAYTAKHFPPDYKEKMDVLVNNLLTAFKIRLDELDWMDDETRGQALKKLATFDPRIGYPSKWRDYSSLIIVPGKLFESIQNAHQFEWNRKVSRLNEPVDREDWYMTPPTVNAYYDPLMNQITFPAAILQPPFFDAKADPAVNYGGIGAVIGHEIGHGFDDQGREFDENGKIRNWWTPATEKQFEALTQELGNQYSAYCPIAGDDKICVNGDLTMGENIGDLGGLQMAYTAYKLSLNGKEAPVIDGFTGDQRFFMSWAQVWRGLSREDALRNLLLTNPHAPEMVRGQNPQRNIDAWYDAFNVKEGDNMYLPPDQRVQIW
ncbi:MAG: M13 family metallopeptidase [Halioglobus sp.]|nr:M13 family metallopeptidase [Halioglobus sp.]